MRSVDSHPHALLRRGLAVIVIALSGNGGLLFPLGSLPRFIGIVSTSTWACGGVLVLTGLVLGRSGAFSDRMAFCP